MKPPPKRRAAASPSRGRHQRPGKAGSAVAHVSAAPPRVARIVMED
jgi:hypothetical protein